MQIAVRVGTDPPVVHAAAVGNGLDVHEALVRIPWRLAVQKEAGYPSHAQSLTPQARV